MYVLQTRGHHNVIHLGQAPTESSLLKVTLGSSPTYVSIGPQSFLKSMPFVPIGQDLHTDPILTNVPAMCGLTALGSRKICDTVQNDFAPKLSIRP